MNSICQESSEKSNRTGIGKPHHLHEYLRHIFSSYIQWNCFFATFNFASIGWILTSFEEAKLKPYFVYIIAGTFITQNILGVIASKNIMVEMKDFGDRVSRLDDEFSYMPVDLYKKCIGLMAVGLLSIIFIWGCLMAAIRFDYLI